MAPTINIIVVIPAYNEAGCISEVIDDWNTVIKKIPGTAILVINDGSTDATGTILDGLASKINTLQVIHQSNSGYGKTVLRGYQHAIDLGAEWIFEVDSDNQQIPADFWKLWERRNESDFILGWRSHRDEPGYRLLISFLTRILALVIFGVKIKDLNIPFRLMKAKFLSTLIPFVPNNPFAPNVHLAILARKKGVDTLDIPVGHKSRTTGTPHVRAWKWIKVCARCVKELFILRMSI